MLIGEPTVELPLDAFLVRSLILGARLYTVPAMAMMLSYSQAGSSYLMSPVCRPLPGGNYIFS